jgi:hypothetical protein
MIVSPHIVWDWAQVSHYVSLVITVCATSCKWTLKHQDSSYFEPDCLTLTVTGLMRGLLYVMITYGDSERMQEKPGVSIFSFFLTPSRRNWVNFKSISLRVTDVWFNIRTWILRLRTMIIKSALKVRHHTLLLVSFSDLALMPCSFFSLWLYSPLDLGRFIQFLLHSQ